MTVKTLDQCRIDNRRAVQSSYALEAPHAGRKKPALIHHREMEVRS